MSSVLEWQITRNKMMMSLDQYQDEDVNSLRPGDAYASLSPLGTKL